MAPPSDRDGGGEGGATAVLALLLLGDGRFPAGGHAHSGGVEAAVADGRVTGGTSLDAFARGRLATTGLVDAALAAATVSHLDELLAHEPAGAPVVGERLGLLDAEAHARLPSPPLREASRRLGRQLGRAAGRCWPAAILTRLAIELPAGAHLPVATGAVAVAAGLSPTDAARLTVHHTITTPAQAAVRLLGLDPFEAAAVVARLAREAEDVVAEAVVAADGPLSELPARTGPLVEIAAVAHRGWDVRMFAT